VKILFIGGTGIISSACAQLALDRGHDLHLLNRGQTTKRPVPAGARLLIGNARDPESLRLTLGSHSFDAVVDWIAFTPMHIQQDLDAFRGRAGQFVFISSASAYQTPPASLPVTESTLLDNPYWEYSRNKIACEEMLVRAYRETKFPITIVRPSHTYDHTLFPFSGGYTVLGRMRAGKPVIVHGDGTSLWVLTHHRDFAVGLVGLLGNPRALGEAVHLTSDEWLNWNQIFGIVGSTGGATPKIVHIPSDFIARFDPDWGAGLLGDKATSMVFDNTKIRRLVPDFHPIIPFAQGAREIVAWHDADPARPVMDAALDARMDEIIRRYETAFLGA